MKEKYLPYYAETLTLIYWGAKNILLFLKKIDLKAHFKEKLKFCYFVKLLSTAINILIPSLLYIILTGTLIYFGKWSLSVTFV